MNKKNLIDAFGDIDEEIFAKAEEIDITDYEESESQPPVIVYKGGKKMNKGPIFAAGAAVCAVAVAVIVPLVMRSGEGFSSNTGLSSDTADKTDNVSSSDLSISSVTETISITAAKNEDDPIVQDDSKYKLIGAYLNDENEVCVNFSGLPKSEDYDLFRKYFFGAWESPDRYLPQSLTIDDSENINFAGRGYFGEFYQPSDNVIAFTLLTNGDANVLWLNMADPDVMYTAVFMMKNGTGVFTLDGSISEVHTITKSDALPNEPSDGFLSIFKLHEMSCDHSIDFDLLTYIDYGIVDGKHLLHSATYDFYPMYLVSEAEDKIVIRTSVSNVGDIDIKPVDVICTFEKAEGEWSRSVELKDPENNSIKPNNGESDEEVAFLAYAEQLVNSVGQIEELKRLLMEIEGVTDVQVYNSSDASQNSENQITEGKAKKGTIVKVFYDNGKSWVEYTKQ